MAPNNQPGKQPGGSEGVERARASYRDCWRAWRANFSAGDLAAANDVLVQADELAQQWTKAGRLEGLLEPLLAETEEPDVRGAAARELLAHRVNGKALATLRQLRESDDPRVVKFATQALKDTARLHPGGGADP